MLGAPADERQCGPLAVMSLRFCEVTAARKLAGASRAEPPVSLEEERGTTPLGSPCGGVPFGKLGTGLPLGHREEILFMLFAKMSVALSP